MHVSLHILKSRAVVSVMELSIASDCIVETKQALAQHRLYALIDSPAALHVFMQHHIFCVWDFMSLVKSLQLNLTGMQLPWLPSQYPQLARLINEIGLDEETDCIEGHPTSHFQLYVTAMEEAGADVSLINTFIGHLGNQVPLQMALEAAEVPQSAQNFIKSTFQTLENLPEVQATVFFHAREDIIPPMFIEMVRNLQNTGLNCRTLLLYLERHIELDGGTHGPKAQQILQQMFSQKPELLPEATQAVEKALLARLALWNQIADAIESL